MKEIGRKTFAFRGAKIFNILPENLRSEVSLLQTRLLQDQSQKQPWSVVFISE